MGPIPENIIDEIRNRADIVEVISGYIPLKRAGRNFKAICPFHNEKTPSLIVSPDKQIYHCFGCGQGGNIFSFIMKQERCEFFEAVRIMADRTNVKIPEQERGAAYQTGLAEAIRRVNDVIASFYTNCLLNRQQGSRAMSYLSKRGITDKTITDFRLGYAPPESDGLKKEISSRGIGLKLLQDLRPDIFRDRIMFPILDVRSRVIGFGGRIIIDDEKAPKYLNSQETAAYVKGRHLYGLNLAKDSIIKEDRCIIVEGYIDCISLHQYGFTNTVASLGTALTQEQVRILKRYTKNVVMLYDADEAGESATQRGIGIFLEEDMFVKIACLPEGFDPDSYVHKEGKLNFEQRLNNASDFIDYTLSRAILRHNPESSDGKVAISCKLLPVIAKVNNAILRMEYIKKLAEALKVGEDVILLELRKIAQGTAKRTVKPSTTADTETHAASRPVAKDGRLVSERILSGLMLDDACMIPYIKSRMSVEEFVEPDIRRIVSALFDLSSRGEKGPTPAKLISFFRQDEQAARLVSELLLDVAHIKDRYTNADDCIDRIRRDRLREDMAELRKMIEAASSEDDEKRTLSLLSKYNELIRYNRIKEKIQYEQ